MDELDIEVVEATISSLDEFIILLDQVGEWLWHKGVKQWKPGIHYKNRAKLAHLVENGCLILDYHQEKLAGGCILSEVMPQEWPDTTPDGLVLYSLVVARFAAGRGVGRQIIQTCLPAALRKQKARIRLDCWDGNEFLKAYYQGEGFKMLETIQESDYFVRLFEIEVHPSK